MGTFFKKGKLWKKGNLGWGHFLKGETLGDRKLGIGKFFKRGNYRREKT